jgi:hypothetical protein
VNVAKLGSKAGNFFSGKREVERDRKIDGETERQRERDTQRQS